MYGANSLFLYERFAFYCTPLLLTAFAVWFEHSSESLRLSYVVAAYAAAAAALLLPLTGTLDGSPSHSPTLAALVNLAPLHQGSGQIIWVPLLAMLAIGVAWSGPNPRGALLIVAVVVCGITTVGASRALIHRAATHPTPHVAVRNGAAFLTTSTADLSFFERTLFWSPAITRVLALGPGGAPDGYGAETVTLSPNGVLAGPDGAPAPGPYVIAPRDLGFVAGRTHRQPGSAWSRAHPDAVVFGYVRRSGYLTTFSNIVLAGGHRGRVLTHDAVEPSRHQSRRSDLCGTDVAHGGRAQAGDDPHPGARRLDEDLRATARLRLADRRRRPDRRCPRANPRYLISVSSLNIGRYIEMTIVPTITPTPIIRIGSMIEVSEAMLASTSSS